MAGFCRQWIPAYAPLTRPLYDLTLHDTPEPLLWSPVAESSFSALKQALSAAPALGLPNYSKPFTLFCHEHEGFALDVLTQSYCSAQRHIAYFSTTLDPVASGLPPCLQAVAAAALLAEHSADLVLGHTSVVAIPHYYSISELSFYLLLTLLNTKPCFCLLSIFL